MKHSINSKSETFVERYYRLQAEKQRAEEKIVNIFTIIILISVITIFFTI